MLEYVDGYLDGGRRDGSVTLDSQNGFSMHYTNVYAEPMVYRSATGQVVWNLSPETNTVSVNNPVSVFFSLLFNVCSNFLDTIF